jgi:hypothetical protein
MKKSPRKNRVSQMSKQNKRPMWHSGVLGASFVYLALLSPVAPLAVEATRASSLAAGDAAHQARGVSLNESGDLHLTSRYGFTLNEQGAATGTVPGTIYVHLKIVSTSRVTAEVNIYPKGGSISGYGSAAYRRKGAKGNFSGSLSISRGSGSFNHARGSGLSFSGTIQRSNYAVTVHVSGTITD